MDDLLEYFKLDTQQFPDYTQHLVRGLDPYTGRYCRVEERWTRKKLLGRGGFGSVWLEETGGDTHKARAVKELMRDSPIDFKRELLAIAKFSKYTEIFAHFYGWYETSDAVFFTMEYFKHGDLGRCLTAPLPEHDAKIITRQLLEGISIMHGAGFAHRDLKPQNIFVVSTSPIWAIKIGDFGISKRIRENDTALRTRVLTEEYSAPELHYFVDEDIESDDYNNAVDMWSSGCLIHNVLTHTVPFPSKRDLKAFCRGKSKFPTQELEKCQVSSKGIEFIQDLLALRPSDRPAAVKAIHAAWLDHAERGKAVEQSSTPSRTRSDPCQEDMIRAPLSVLKLHDADSSISGEETIRLVLNRSGDHRRFHSGSRALDPMSRPAHADQAFRRALTDFSGPPLHMELNHFGANGTHAESQNPGVPSKTNKPRVNLDSNQPTPSNYKESKPITQLKPVNPKPVKDKLPSAEDISALNYSMKAAINNADDQLMSQLLSKSCHKEALNRRDEMGRTPLHWAVDCREIQKQWIQTFPRAAVPKTPVFALDRESSVGQRKIVKAMLLCGADIEARDTCRGYTPLLLALRISCYLPPPLKVSYFYDPHIPWILLEHGADVHARAPSRKTPLHYAALQTCSFLVNLLISKGADLEAEDDSRMTPLGCAIRQSMSAIVELLLQHGARVPARVRVSETRLRESTKRALRDARAKQELDREHKLKRSRRRNYVPIYSSLSDSTTDTTDTTEESTSDGLA